MGRVRLLLLLLIWALLLPSAASARPRKHAKRRRPAPERWCLDALTSAGVAWRPGPKLASVRTPVTLTTGRVGTLLMTNGRKPARPVMDCRTAWTLLRISRIFAANGGIDTLIVGNFYSYRYVKNSARLSRHAFGLAIDLYGVRTHGGATYMVDSDYATGLGGQRTCEGTASRRGARLLRQLACDLDRSQFFKAILTPDSDRDHRDHFHLSLFHAGEKKARRNRTTLIEHEHYGKKWARALPRRGHPSRGSVTRTVRRRYRLNRRFIRAKARARRLKARRRRRHR